MHILVLLMVSHSLKLYSFSFCSLFISSPQTEWFQMTYLQVRWLFLLPAQICYWSPLVIFVFVTVHFNSRIIIWFLSIISFSLLIFFICSYIVPVSVSSLSMVSNCSLRIFKTVDLEPLSDWFSVSASSGTIYVHFFLWMGHTFLFLCMFCNSFAENWTFCL